MENRREKDIKKLIRNGFKVKLVNDDMNHFQVELEGPRESPYGGFKWWLIVELPEDFPNQPPMLCFKEPIFHPNIDERSGHVCGDFVDKKWNPSTELFALVAHFIPALLMDPYVERGNGFGYNQEAAELYSINVNIYG